MGVAFRLQVSYEFKECGYPQKPKKCPRGMHAMGQTQSKEFGKKFGEVLRIEPTSPFQVIESQSYDKW